MIEVIPVGGLGNRIRAIASATALADSLKKPILIIWNVNDELNCAFHDLFSRNNEVSVQMNSNNIVTRIKRLLRQIKSGKKKVFVSKLWVHNKINEGWPKSKFEKHFMDLHNTYLVVEADCPFYPTGTDSYRYLQINDDIQSSVNSIKKNFNQRVVGVHIRRSDNHISTDQSPTHLFIDAMRNEIAAQPDTTFFLATDSLEDERILKQEFGNRVFTYSTEKNRNTKNGMMQAAIDLYCLASTNKILGSYWSSFSEVASELGGIPLTMIQKECR